MRKMLLAFALLAIVPAAFSSQNQIDLTKQVKGVLPAANGGTGTAVGALDTIPLVTAPGVLSYVAIPDCVDTAGKHLNYTVSTHTFSCGTSGGSGGTVTSFSAPSPSWPSWLVPTVIAGTSTPELDVAASAIPTSALAGPFAQTLASASHEWLKSFDSSTGLFTQTQPTYADMTGTIPTWNQSTTGNAATATAFDHTPTTCLSTEAATGVDASGNATGCWSPASGSMTWPLGGAGIPNYDGSSAWGTSYSAGNQIPSTFIPTLNQNTTGTSGGLTGTPNISVGAVTASSVTDSGLTSGNCVQASTGGILTTTAGACGTSSGTITATGSPVSGNLAFFSGPTSITNGNLSGDATTSGTGAVVVTKINGTSLAALGTGIVKNTTGTGIPSIAVAADFPALNQNTTGTAANLSGTPALPNGTTATTQTLGDNTTKLATDAFVIANVPGGMVYPGAGIGVSTGSAWGTSKTAPTGTIVGTSDTQTLTNKILDGVTPTVMGYLDATSSIQTQLGLRAPLASPTFTGTVTMPAPTLNSITGSTQCLHVDTLGVVSGAGADCGVSSMVWPAAAGIAVYGGSSAWGTSLTAPSGAIMGTTDIQTATNKTIDGVTPTVFGYLDPTSSVQTQLNSKAATASLAAVATSGAYSSLSGKPTLAQTLASVSHKWLNSYDAATGLFTSTQPTYADIGGAVPAWNQSTTGNAATATALASAPTTCTSTQAATGITANGNATGCWTPSSGSMAWPAAAGIAVYSGSSSWATSLTAPSGTIVGTTDTQTLTNKTVDTATATELSYVHGVTSSIQTQLDSKLSATPADISVVVSSGTLGANTCSSATPATMTGLTTSMLVEPGYTSNPAALTGWGAVGGMTFKAWPSATNTVSWILCNQTSASISYSGITFQIGAR